jgi:hypothetical protein
MTQWSSLVGERLSIELGTDDSTTLYTDARRQAALLEAEREFARLSDCLVVQSTITCSNGVAEYNLLSTVNITNANFSHVSGQQPEYRLISSVSTQSGSTHWTAGSLFPRTDIERLNREDPGWRDSTGASAPASWYLRRDAGRLYLGLTPPPTIKSSEAGAVVFPYIAQPTQTTISTGSTGEPFTFGGASSVRLDLRPYHQGLVHYGAYKLFKLRRDTVASQEQLQTFLAYVSSYLQDTRSRGGQRISLAKTYFRDASKHRDRPTDPRR